MNTRDFALYMLESGLVPLPEEMLDGETEAEWYDRMGLPPPLDLSDEALAKLPVFDPTIILPKDYPFYDL